MSLKAYAKKRDFSQTPEPAPELSAGFCAQIERTIQVPKDGRPLYMVHDHHARAHHHDLRLERDGVLSSWAIPKLIDPRQPYRRALAIQTEDHPLAYGYWEGAIPAGNYGAGESRIWDTGTVEFLDVQKNKLIFRLAGRKLQGTFVLILFRPEEKAWLFFKKKEEGPAPQGRTPTA
ncbi:MAG: 3'-phosphoesterase [Candidatus Aenigmarchaeota archaeon]|nr:3'-phosphoesterase [Candidatus Aenigmarchaeota archaeon]